GAETAKRPAVDGDLDATGNDDAEQAVAIAFANNRDIGRNLAPDRDPQNLPELDILELGKEVELAQHFEVLGILRRLVLLDKLIAHRREVFGELGAIAVAAVQVLFQRPPD